MTDQQLREYSADNLYYELFMSYETAARLTTSDPAVLEDDVIVRNALIESFAIHGRVLALFLYPEQGRRRGGDVSADEYVENAKVWNDAKPTISRELTTIIDRTGKEIAHLTTGRHPRGSPLKRWDPAPFVCAFFEPLQKFKAHVPSGRLDVSVAAFIAELQQSSEPHTYKPSDPMVVPAPTNLTTETPSAITDVATTAPPYLPGRWQKGGL